MDRSIFEHVSVGVPTVLRSRYECDGGRTGKGLPHPCIHCSYLVLDTMCLVCTEYSYAIKLERDLRRKKNLQLSIVAIEFPPFFLVGQKSH